MTIFTNPVTSRLISAPARLFLRLKGWRIEGEAPGGRSYVAALAPHTSNWDFLYFISASFTLDINIRWFGKHTLFKGPMGPIMRWLGGIPIHRGEAGDMVERAVAALTDRNQSITLGIAPEGTRSRAEKWKSGFLRIASAANVPVLLAGLDYERKLVSLGPLFETSDDLEADMKAIRHHFSAFTGKNPDQFA